MPKSVQHAAASSSRKPNFANMLRRQHSRKKILYPTDKTTVTFDHLEPTHSLRRNDYEDDYKIRGTAQTPQEFTTTNEHERPPCAVCMRHFDSKDRFYKHLRFQNHTRSPRYVFKRLPDNDAPIKGKKRQRDRETVPQRTTSQEAQIYSVA